MTQCKWEEGKSYRLVDREGFADISNSNENIALLLGDSVFQVTRVSTAGRVLSIKDYHPDQANVDYWFYDHDLQYFELVEESGESTEVFTTQTANVMPINYHIAEWLEKWSVVYNKCPDVGGFDFDFNDNLMITTDFGDIRGAAAIVDFVNTRYTKLKSEEADKRKAELEAKRLKVLQELSEIDQELGRY